MSMSQIIVGFRAPDDTWRKYKEVYDACTHAGVTVPEEVEEFFNWDEPNELGIRENISNTEAVTPYNAEMREGFDIELAKLPANITHIRVYNSY